MSSIVNCAASSNSKSHPDPLCTMVHFQHLPHANVYFVPTLRDHPLFIEESDIGEINNSSGRGDAFLHYSDNEVRMRRISGGLLGAPQQSAATEVIRKTRISFEMHSSAFFEDLFADDLLADDINEEAAAKTTNDNHQMAALVDALFGEGCLQANVRIPKAA